MNFQEIACRFCAETGQKSMTPQGFLFDMDGTLYNSMPNHAQAWYRMVTELGIEADPDEFFLYEGATGAWTINTVFMRAYGHNATDEEVQNLYQRKSEIFRSMPAPRVMDGAKELVGYVCSLPWHPATVIVTGSAQGSLLGRLDEDFPGIFPVERRITGRNVTHSKPHPDPYLRGAELASHKPCECIAIENAPLGVESAARSGAFTVAVQTGPVPAERLAEAGAHIVFPSMPECARQFPSLIQALTQCNR